MWKLTANALLCISAMEQHCALYVPFLFQIHHIPSSLQGPRCDCKSFRAAPPPLVSAILSQQDPTSLGPSVSGIGSRTVRLRKRSGEAAPFCPMPQDWAALWICHSVSRASALECLSRSAWPCGERKSWKIRKDFWRLKDGKEMAT